MLPFPKKALNTYNPKKHVQGVMKLYKNQEMSINTKMKLYHPKEIKHLCFHSKLKFSPSNIIKQNNSSENKTSYYASPKKSDDNLTNATTYLYDSRKEHKEKKVTFSTVEIVRVVKYKKYNLATTFPKYLIRKNLEKCQAMKQSKDEMCLTF